MKKIFITAGKARAGKDTICGFIKEITEEKNLKVINLSFASYIKMYVQNISDWDGTEETKEKYRTLLQQVGTEIVRDTIDKNFFIKRIIEDIKVYSNFFDVITISDARYPNEIDLVKEAFENTISINVERLNYETKLNTVEQQHRTETALNDYKNYDYVVLNDTTLDDLKLKIQNILGSELQ